MKQKIASVISAVILCLVSFSFTSCITKDSSVYGEKEVLNYVDEICKVPYELLETELVAEDPDDVEYRFRTSNRDLYFKANSYLAPIMIDASKTPFYTRSLSCDYISNVHSLYYREVEQVLRQDPHYLEEQGWIYVLSFGDLEAVVDTILAADQVYLPESRYNTMKFLRENPLRSIHLVWQRSEEEAFAHETWVNITDIAITGQNDRRELYDALAGSYAQCYVDKEIENGTGILPRYLEGRHRSLLSSIELNGREMLYDRNENPYGPYGLTTDDYKYCWYSDTTDSYMMVIDIGLTSQSMSFPLILREYVLALGGEYDCAYKDDTYRSAWKIGDTVWQMTTRFQDNEILELKFKKNGRPLDISFITSQADSEVGASFCVGVTVSDFCRLFDLTCEVDEDLGKIMFFRG